MSRRPSRGGTLTIEEIKRAGNIYRHAVIACYDLGGALGIDEQEVMQHAIDLAKASLDRLGVAPSEVTSLGECIDAARWQR